MNKQRLKSGVRGFFGRYGKIMLALLGIALATYMVMALFTQAAFRSGERSFEIIDLPDETGGQYWDLSAASVDNTRHNMISSVYYPNKLLTPENIDDHTPQPIPEGAPVANYITQRFTVKVPITDQAYKIWFAGLHWSARAWANGVLINESGNPADNSADMRVSRVPLIIYAAPDENGIIDIVYQTASFRHHEDLAYNTEAHISLASLQYEPSVRKGGRSFDVVLVGMYIGFGLLTLGLFFTRPKNTEHLWFALCCFIMAVVSGLEGGRFTNALPFISEDFVYYTYYAGTPILAFLMMLYLNRMFPGVMPKVILLVLGGATAVAVCVVAFTPPSFFTLFVNRYRLFLPLVYLAFLVPLVIRFRKPLPEQIISLFGLILFIVGNVFDMLRNTNSITWWTAPYTATELFTVVFVLTQLIALFMGNYRAKAAAEESERRIATEKEAIERVNQLKTEFLANVSHELKTPLTVMSSHAQHGQKTLASIPEAEDAERSMRLIAGEADRLALMVTQVLDVAQIDEGRMAMDMREVALSQLIPMAMDTYYPMFSKNNNVLQVVPASPPPVMCDPDRIIQVLVNLVSNAVKHTRDGTITISTQQEGDRVVVRVADTGTGIAPEELETLFQRYRTKKAPGETGTGLGLYISRYIVEAHGGQLSIESAVGHGTTASFTLPVAPA